MLQRQEEMAGQNRTETLLKEQIKRKRKRVKLFVISSDAYKKDQ